MEAVDISSIVAWRAVERLIGVLIGGAAIYLGFRLFMALPERSSDSEGKFDLPGGISIYVSRVGPGVFFALFGTALVSLSFVHAVRLEPGGVPMTAAIDSAGTNQATQPPTSAGSFSYVSGDAGGAQVSLERGTVVRDIRTLQEFEQTLAAFEEGEPLALPAAHADGLLIALPRIKRMMLYGVWDPQWGDYNAFARWVQAGAFDPPPSDLDAQIVALFASPE